MDNTPSDIHDPQALMEELEQFRKEKEKIRMLVGQIGGKDSAKHDKVVNIVFCVLLSVLLSFDVARHAFHLHVPLPPLFSLELGIFLVSLKIIWMMHRQSKVDHFQFWILNSIEFRLNEITKRIKKVEKRMPES